MIGVLRPLLKIKDTFITGIGCTLRKRNEGVKDTHHPPTKTKESQRRRMAGTERVFWFDFVLILFILYTNLNRYNNTKIHRYIKVPR